MPGRRRRRARPVSRSCRLSAERFALLHAKPLRTTPPPIGSVQRRLHDRCKSMDESPSAASLHEYVDVEITLAEPVTPAQEKALRDNLTDHDGVQTVSIMREKVSVNYEPVSVSAKDLLSAAERAGVALPRRRVQLFGRAVGHLSHLQRRRRPCGRRL